MRKTGVKSASSLRLSSSLDEKDIDFSKAMKMAGVEPLGEDKRVRHAKKTAAPVPSQTIADNRQVLEDSLSDELDSVEFLESEDGLAFRRPGVGPDVPRDLRRGRWSVVGQIDLHGMFVDEARDAVAQFLKRAQATERLCVRIIHGKGNGSPNRQSVLREKVRRWLKQRDEVIAFAEPRENDGGAGATLVRLRPQKRH
ncbi:MAG TPA: DNA mismatch repair protein MutS [Sutterella sp.]|nr:DNA mismatch repair protein MutS [Sutterella sp.]